MTRDNNGGEAPGGTKWRRERLPPYRPFSSLAGLAITAFGLSGALIKGFPLVALGAGSLLVGLDGKSADGEPGFFGRIPNNTYIVMMVSLLLLVLIYSFLQFYAVHRDFRWFASKAKLPKENTRPWGILDGFFSVLTGRPKGFYSEPVPGPYGDFKERLGDHLKFGMPSLAMPMRFFLWSFPMLGFLGTAIGLSNAIRLLPSAMGKGGGSALEPVLKQLAFKFDTTILGIVSALIMMVMIQLYERSWERLEILADRERENAAARKPAE